MILGRDGEPRPPGADERAPSPAALGEALRKERLGQGLSMDGAAARFGLPVAHLDALEAGALGRLPDRVEILQAMRRYADALGLPGDRFVLDLVETWPRDDHITGVVPAVRRGAVPSEPEPAGSAPPGRLGAGVPGIYTTGPVPVTPGPLSAAAGGGLTAPPAGATGWSGGPGPGIAPLGAGAALGPSLTTAVPSVAAAPEALAPPAPPVAAPVAAPVPTAAAPVAPSVAPSAPAPDVAPAAAEAVVAAEFSPMPAQVERTEGRRRGRKRSDPPVPVYSLSGGVARREGAGGAGAGAAPAAVADKPGGGTVVVPLGTFISTPDPGTAQVPAYLNTGQTPAVGRGAVGPVHASWYLRLVVVLVVSALLASVAGLVIHDVKPQWLRDIGIGRKAKPAKGASSSTTLPTVPTTTSTTLPITGSGHTGPVNVVTTSPASATIDVKESTASMGIEAVGAICWIDATEPQRASPLFVGDLQPGQLKGFDIQGSLTLEIGSGAGHLFIARGSKILATFIPPEAPYTVTVRTVG